jgi:hypothetical protein
MRLYMGRQSLVLHTQLKQEYQSIFRGSPLHPVGEEDPLFERRRVL